MAKKKKLATKKPTHFLKAALEILARAGMPRPGSSGDAVSYVIRLNENGVVEGVNVHMTDEAMEEALDALTTR
jgi:hypothetical protein